jgi:hypothetical protein
MKDATVGYERKPLPRATHSIQACALRSTSRSGCGSCSASARAEVVRVMLTIDAQRITSATITKSAGIQRPETRRPGRAPRALEHHEQHHRADPAPEPVGGDALVDAQRLHESLQVGAIAGGRTWAGGSTHAARRPRMCARRSAASRRRSHSPSTPSSIAWVNSDGRTCRSAS